MINTEKAYNLIKKNISWIKKTNIVNIKNKEISTLLYFLMN